MRIALAYSSKNGLYEEFKKRSKHIKLNSEIPVDFFAEGDSEETLNEIINALRISGHTVKGFEAADDLTGNLKSYKPEIVFNMSEGLYGDFRESYVPMICERLCLPYTGSDPLTLALCLNKARAKEILSYYHIPTPNFQVFHKTDEISLNGFDFPGIVKPVAEGSSKGIFNDSVVENLEQAKDKITFALLKYNEPVILEKFLDGLEFTVAVWGNGSNTSVLPIVAIDHSTLPAGARPLYSYEAKWIWDTKEKPLDIFKCPAQINSDIEKRIEETVLATYKVLQIRDWCRIDIRLGRNSQPNVLEINPIPGILPNPEENSCFPKAARTAGYSYTDMLNQIVRIAAERIGLAI
jgi:D-alanine-D-alanine ligase